MKMKTDIGFGVSIEIHKDDDTPNEMSGLIIENKQNKHKVML